MDKEALKNIKKYISLNKHGKELEKVKDFDSGNIYPYVSDAYEWSDEEFLNSANKYKDEIKRVYDVNSEKEYMIQDDRQRIKVIKNLPYGKTVLEVGCSDGTVSLAIAENDNVKQVTGIDIRKDVIKDYNNLIIKLSKENKIKKEIVNKVKIEVSSISDYAKKNIKFDTVCAYEVLEHIQPNDFYPTINKLIKLLKPNGNLLISVPNRYCLDKYEKEGRSRWNWHDHKNYFSRLSLEIHLNKYFDQVKFIPHYADEESKDGIYLIASCSNQNRKLKLIVDACSNHLGDVSIAKEMIHVAKESGADIIKFQSWKIEDNQRNEKEKMAQYQLSEKAHYELLEECKKVDIPFLTTCFSSSMVEFLANLGLEHIKVGSAECGNYKLLEKLAKHFPHMFVSTGMHYDEEVLKTNKLLREKASSYTLFHCVSMYPINDKDFNLNRLKWLQEIALSVGYSDHSKGDDFRADAMAMTMGVDYIERHFILDMNNTKAKDQPVSIDSNGIKYLVKLKNDVEEQERIATDNPILYGKKHRDLPSGEAKNREHYIGRWGK